MQARGTRGFDQFQKSLGIAPNILTRRLTALTNAGLLERRRYSERPPRDEYVLTQSGRDFLPVLHALGAWGGQTFSDGRVSGLVDAVSGERVEPVVVDRGNRAGAGGYRSADSGAGGLIYSPSTSWRAFNRDGHGRA